MADGSWYLAPVGKRSPLSAWDCVAGRKCGRNRPSVGASQAATSGSKSGGLVMLRCGRRQIARSRLRSSPRSKRSGEALLVKNSSSRRLLPSPSSRVLTRGSTRQPWTPRVQQASVEAALETSREAGAHRAGFGGDVGMLLSLLAEAIRKGQQQCYLPP